jgi:hypothetical protein
MVCGILVWPMWVGNIYSNNAKVTVPDYYIKANNAINNDNKDGRILFLPLIQGDSIYHTWGYGGIESTYYIFIVFLWLSPALLN